MSGTRQSLEDRVANLEQEVRGLRETLGALQAMQPEKLRPIVRQVESGSEDASEELLTWIGKSSLLPRISAVCFLLVLALILRTITDNNILDKQIGSLIGMGYAALLISVGWYKYSRSGSLAPIFAVCGAILMYSVVTETHAHFESLPSVPAYFILLVTGVAMATISYLYHNALPVLIGTLGMGLASIAIDYPNPYFPHLALVLLVANLLGAFATRLQRCSWLRWALLIITAAMLQVWGLKIGLKLGRAGTPGDLHALGSTWYLPVVALFFIVFLGIGVLAITRREGEKTASFDLALPTFNVAWAFASAVYLLRVRGSGTLALAIIALAAVIVHFCIAWWVYRNRKERPGGINAYIFAGTVLLVLDLPLLVGGIVPALPIYSLAALGLVFLSNFWQRGGIRGISYLLQIGAGVGMVVLLVDQGPGGDFLLLSLALGGLAFFGLAHFRWCRQRKPPTDSRLFSKWDAEDRSAVLVLLSSLVAGFFWLREGLYQAFLKAGEFTEEIIGAMLQGGATVIVNFAAAGLLLFAFGRRNKELRNVAVLITLIGAGRVFIFDLFRIRGVPLVASVFSFGLAILLISVALTRWQKLDVREAGTGETVERPGVKDEDLAGTLPRKSYF